MEGLGLEGKDVAQVLLERNVLTPAQYGTVRRRQKMLGISDHKAILDLNLVSELDTMKTLAELSGMEFVDLTQIEIPKEILNIISLETLLHYRILPIAQTEDGALTVVSSEILSLNETGALRLLANKRIHFVLSTPSMIRALTRKTYGLGVDTIQKLRSDQGEKQISTQEIVFDIKDQEKEGAPVETSAISFVDQILL